MADKEWGFFYAMTANIQNILITSAEQMGIFPLSVHLLKVSLGF